jgi:Tfp pilus assembly protein PilX
MTCDRRCSGDGGASLIVALAMIMIVSLALVALLAYVSTSLRTVTAVRDQRNDSYAADGAVDTAIQFARQNPTLGGTATSCDNWSLTLGTATATCQVVTSRDAGTITAGSRPPYALWSVGTSDAETGLVLNKSGCLQVGGPIVSNSGAGATPGVSASNIDLREPPNASGGCGAATTYTGGFTVRARGTCVGTIYVFTAADQQCATGQQYPDPGYPSQTLPALTNPNPAPVCAATNAALQFTPGYYTNADLFNSPSYGSCRTGFLYFQPGVYYFDFGFDPTHPQTTWSITGTVVGGVPKGWNPNTGIASAAGVSATGTSLACQTELDGATSGVQFVFGGLSRIDASSNSTALELCADPAPDGTTQQIVVYGQRTGSAASPQAKRLMPTGVKTPTPFSPTANLLVVPPATTPIDDTPPKVATATVAAANPGGSASVTMTGFPGAAVPGGSVGVSYTLTVGHKETYARTSDVASLRLTFGASCILNLTPRSTYTKDTFTGAQLPACFAAAVQSGSDTTFLITAAKNKAVTEALDGLLIDVAYTPPVVRPQSGCTLTDVANCSVISGGSNKATTVFWGTVYAPLGSVNVDFKNLSVFQFRRGVIARAISISNVPPSDTSSSFCLGYGTTCNAPARTMRFIASVGGHQRVVALVGFTDAPALGTTTNVIAWNVIR